MKKNSFFLLLFLFIFSNSILKSQEVFEEDGKYGLRFYEDDIILPASYFQIIYSEAGFLLCLPRDEKADLSHIRRHQPEDMYLWNPETQQALNDSEAPASFPFHDDLYYGFIPWESDAKKMIPAVYEEIRPVGYNGFVQVYDGLEYHLWDSYKAKKTNITSDSPIMLVKHDEPSSGFIYEQKGYYGVLGEDASVIVKPQFLQIKLTHDMIVGEDDKGWYFMYPENFKIINNKPFEAIYLEEGIEGGILYKQKGKYGLLDEYGSEGLFSPAYEGIKQVLPYVYAVKINGKWGVTHSEDGGIEEPFLPFKYDSIAALPSLPDYIGVYEGGKLGLVITDSWSVVLPPSIEAVYDPEFDGSYEWFFFKEGNQLGIMEDATFKKLLPANYDDILPVPHTGIVGLFGYIVTQNGKKGYLSPDFSQKVSIEWDEASFDAQKNEVILKRGEETAFYNIKSGQLRQLESIEKKLHLKWKANIGLTTFRTNMMLANGALLIGSNGNSRSSIHDDKDGLYLLDPQTGNTKLRIQPDMVGDTDVNGMAVSDGHIFFGNDNGHVYCYDFEGKELWKTTIDGDIEGSPALTDLNGDGKDDVVVATENSDAYTGEVVAIDGTNGKRLWTFKPPQGYFTASPALYDGSGDFIDDIYIGTGGSPWFYAIDGKTGKEMWSFHTKSTAGFVDGSAVHASALAYTINGTDDFGGETYIVATECYGMVHYLTPQQGKWVKYFGTSIGAFSSPIFGPMGSAVNGASWGSNGNIDISLAYEEQGWEDAPYKELKPMALTNPYLINADKAAKTSASAVVADILNEGHPQFIIADEQGKMQLIGETGTILQEFNLPAGVEATAFVADIDKDGKLELLVACLNGYLYCYDTDAPASKVVWGQFRGDNKNKGILFYD